MTTEFTSTPDDFSPPARSNPSTFAATPAWERGKKRRGSEAEVAAEPRSFASDTSETSASVADDFRPIENGRAAMGEAEATEATFAAAPAYATRTATRKNSAAPLAIAAGIILVGGLAAAGWYYTQPHAQGVAELTPGSASTTTTTATASTAGAPLPGEQVAQNTAPPAATPEAAPPVAPSHAMSTTTTTNHKAAPTVTHRTTTTVARARTATPSAPDVGADAAARAPAQAAPTPAAPPLVLNLPSASQPAPVQTAPAPAPTQAPPAETPPQ